MQAEIQFSERESQVIGLLLQGKSNKQIALALGVSVRAIEFHLSNIYSKLGVGSRTEAVLRLSAGGLRESTGAAEGVDLREAAVVEMGTSADNGLKPVSPRRLSLTRTFFALTALLTAALLFSLFFANPPVPGAQSLPAPAVTRTGLPPSPTVTPTPPPAVSSKGYILEQIRQAVAEYEQNVQAEKKTGKVEFGKHPLTGEDVFLFKDESYMRVMDFSEKTWDKINQLDALYAQVYRDELNPTPFPTRSSAAENKAAYDALLTQNADDVCSLAAWQKYPAAETVRVYDIDEGNYRVVYIGDALARCDVFGQMVEEFRLAPIMAKLNKDADIAMIRRVTGKSGLQLTFKSVQPLANAPWLSGEALYEDETGSKYYVDMDSGRLAQLETKFASHPVVPAEKTLGLDELRGIAEQFALANSTRLAELKPLLQYEEGAKTVITFFTWTYRAKDWSGTDWAMMPPFLQVGVLADGQIVTYFNTLDLYK